MDSGDFHIKMKIGARRFCLHRIRVPLPLFILKIVLIIALIVISVLALVHTFILDKILAWKPPPIILVPGLMSSKLYVEGNGIKYPDEFSKECSQNIQFRKSWMSGHLKNEPNCELFLLSLRHEGGKFFDQPNVRITPNLRGIPFGSSLWPVQCIFSDEKPHDCDISTLRGQDDSYFRPLAEFLMAKMKYQEGKTLFAAQYDWRHHQKSVVMDKYYEDLQFLVEHTVNMTKKKAILFGHSMGNIVINRFLREKVDAEWQKEYLQTTINVAAPYGGATKAILSLISGEPMLNGSITPNQAVNFVHQMASIANLLPFKNAFGNETLVKIGPKEYSATKMADFMEAVGIGHLIKFYEENEPIPQEHTPMHCIYSVGQNNTDYKYEYSSTSGEAPKRIEMGEGDGTVNAESLMICKEWKEMGHSVEVKEFVDMKHTEILMKREFFEYIANLLKTL